MVAWVWVMFVDWMDEIVGGVVSCCWACLVALQEAVVPPFEPRQDQFDEVPCAGYVGDEGEAVPVEQYAPWGKDSPDV